MKKELQIFDMTLTTLDPKNGENQSTEGQTFDKKHTYDLKIFKNFKLD